MQYHKAELCQAKSLDKYLDNIITEYLFRFIQIQVAKKGQNVT